MPYQDRLYKMQQLIPGLSCDALLVEDPTNLFYLTGVSLSLGRLLIAAHSAHLLVDNRYFELCKKNSPIPVILATATAFDELLSTEEYLSVRCLGFCSETTSYKNYVTLKASFDTCNVALGNRHQIQLVAVDNPVKFLRRIKDDREIKALREAAVLGSQGFDFICTLLKEGVSERELAVELEIFWKRRGSQALAFDPIIAFGANSSMPHYRAGDAKLQEGDTVLIDIGVTLHNYQSDMTRVLFFKHARPEILAIYAYVEQAQQAALALCRPGTSIAELDQAARAVICSHGHGEHFTHSLGHGVGLDVHELPAIRNKEPDASVVLQPGMVITIEPGIYLPGVGGVRIEDTVCITEKGVENLTNRSTRPIIIY